MATYYVAKTGNNATADATNPATPLLTISASMASASSDGDVVEIIDEGSYDEYNLIMHAENITVRHTASSLGRPKIYTTATGRFAFDAQDDIAATWRNGLSLIGLEIYGYQENMSFYGGVVETNNITRMEDLHISGCYIYKTSFLTLQPLGGSPAEPNHIDQSIIYFDEVHTSEPIVINATGHLEISNCLITSSGGSGGNKSIIDGNSSPHVTASFSTFIHRGLSGYGPQDKPVIENISKVINCIVSASLSTDGSSGGMTDGIQATEHTYNIVRTSGDNWIDVGTGASASQGTGELANTDALFIDESVIGDGVSVAANYDIQSSSPARDAGITFDSIAVDITGTVRPQNSAFDIGAFEYIVAPTPDPPFDPTTPVAGFIYEADLTSRKILKVSGDYAYKYGQDNKQAPFSLTIPGVPTLRNRKTAYSSSR